MKPKMSEKEYNDILKKQLKYNPPVKQVLTLIWWKWFNKNRYKEFFVFLIMGMHWGAAFNNSKNI